MLRWIVESGTPTASSGATAKGRRRERLYAAMAVGFLMAAIFSTVSYWRLARAPVRAIISEIAPPDNARFIFSGPTGGAPVISPNGHALAFPAVDASGKVMLWVRSLDSFVAHPLPGTEGAGSPFWSPDSRALGFFADGKLKTIDASDGPAIVLAAAPAAAGGSWNRDGTILFAPDYAKGLYLVAASGGNPVLVTAVDTSKFTFYAGPRFLPDGKHFLYTAGSGDSASMGTYFASLDGKERRLVVKANGGAVYASGFLLYLREGILLAQAFDLARGQLKGDPHPIAERVVNTFGGIFAVSENGILIYQGGGGGTEKRLTWFDRAGKKLGVTGEVGDYFDVRISPDGQKLASNAGYPAGSPNSEIWVDELARAARMRLTIDPETDHGVPIWSPDGNKILFGALEGKARRGIYQKLADGASGEELLLPSDKQDVQIWPTSWSRDGRFVLYSRGAIILSQADIWVLPLGRDRKPRPFVQGQVAAYDGQFSPDGRWVAYASTESGRDEVYVVPFDATRILNTGPGSVGGGGGKWLISLGGGTTPRWRRDGKEIFYISPTSQMMAAEVEPKGNSIAVRTPQALFRTAVENSFAPFDVTADGKKFVIITQYVRKSCGFSQFMFLRYVPIPLKYDFGRFDNYCAVKPIIEPSDLAFLGQVFVILPSAYNAVALNLFQRTLEPRPVTMREPFVHWHINRVQQGPYLVWHEIIEA